MFASNILAALISLQLHLRASECMVYVQAKSQLPLRSWKALRPAVATAQGALAREC